MRPSQVLRVHSAKITDGGHVAMVVRVELRMLGKLHSHHIQVSTGSRGNMRIRELVPDGKREHPHISGSGMCSDMWPLAQAAWARKRYASALRYLAMGLSVIEARAAYRNPYAMQQCQICSRIMVDNSYMCTHCSMTICSRCLPDGSTVCQYCKEDGYT